MTKYLITGANGMVGQDLRHALAGRDVLARSHSELDITNYDAARDALADCDVVINAAGYTRVDDAEENEEEAFDANATGPENLAIAASETGARLIQLSTDYVFDGHASDPYGEHAPLHPRSAYGRTKAAGEQRAVAMHPDGTYIVRTAWLYGAGGPNFAQTILRQATVQDTVSVVTDQLGQPTWTGDLARQIVQLLDSDAAPGIYHATNSGEASWYDFAREIFQVVGLDPDRVEPTTHDRFGRLAPRPSYAVLGHDGWAATGISPMRNWRAALSAAHSAGVLTAVSIA